MMEKVKKTIERFGMVERGDHLLVAVSGGMDSVSLLHVLMTLKERLGIELTVCHLNHSLRGEESLRDEEFVRRLASVLGLAFEGKRRMSGPSRGREKARSRRLPGRYGTPFLKRPLKGWGRKRSPSVTRATIMPRPSS